jgi:hypothetical protein
MVVIVYDSDPLAEAAAAEAERVNTLGRFFSPRPKSWLVSKNFLRHSVCFYFQYPIYETWRE